MAKLLRKVSPFTILLANLCLAPSAFAGIPGGGILSYAPLSNAVSAVPTLGGGALIALAILLAIIALRVFPSRQNRGVHTLLTLTAITSLVAGVGGVNLVSDAWGPAAGMENPAGGTVKLAPGPNTVPNLTSVLQVVTEVIPDRGCEIGLGGIDNGGGNGGVPALAVAANGGGNGGGELKCAQQAAVPPGEACTVFINCKLIME